MAESKKKKGQEKPAEKAQERDPDQTEHVFDDWDDLAARGDEESRLGRALEGLLPDIVKRGVEGLVSEDGLRSVLTERGLPREAVGFMLGQADATRREIVRIVSNEVRLFLENVDLGGELTKILTSVSFEIRTEVRFIPNDAAVKPNVRNRVKVRANSKEEEGLQEGSEAEEGGWTQEEDLDAEQPKERGRRRRWPLGRSRDEKEESSEAGEEPPSPRK